MNVRVHELTRKAMQQLGKSFRLLRKDLGYIITDPKIRVLRDKSKVSRMERGKQGVWKDFVSFYLHYLMLAHRLEDMEKMARPWVCLFEDITHGTPLARLQAQFQKVMIYKLYVLRRELIGTEPAVVHKTES